jgi:outer membrane protein assembly factor BamB
VRSVPALVLLSCLTLNAEAGEHDWPQFRGREASGIGTGSPPTKWDVSTGENVKWSVSIPGLAHSAPIIWGDRVFVTTATSDDGGRSELTTGWQAADGRSADDDDRKTWSVMCLDASSGRVIWSRDAHSGVPKSKRHPKSSHANCTPATDGKRVVAFFGSEGLFCYDMDGKLLWKRDLGLLVAGPSTQRELQWGFASSPIIHDNLVVVQCDCSNTKFWATFNIETGNEVRRVVRDEDSTWSTPGVFIIEDRAQLVVNGYKHMGGYDLQTGEELWKLRALGDVPVPAPLYAHGLVYLTNAHGGPSPVYAIDPRSRGDLTPSDDRQDAKGLVWWREKEGSYMPTPIVYGDNLYICNDRGVLTVFDAKTGKKLYKTRLDGGGANYTASAVAADGRLYFTSEDGDVHVVARGDEFRLIASNSVAEVTMATPAISRGRLFIRTRSKLYCIAK